MSPSRGAELALIIHNHQPVGNLAAVFRRAYTQCYRPLLDALIAHPGIRLALHHSGSLLEWMLREEPGYLGDLKALVDREQIEIVGGGFYEPMLVMLSDEDIRGQIEMMASFVQTHLGTTPLGLWLAERVWEPDLPRALAPTGVRYVVLDDNHLFAAGIEPGPDGCISGYYVTERAGASLGVFPIARSLRYAIPFQPPEVVIEGILKSARSQGEAGRSTLLTYGDDGEKLGLWHGTEDWVLHQGWVERFFTLLEENADRIQLVTPAIAMARQNSSGRVYIPTTAYEEMDAWALPVAASSHLQRLRQEARTAAPEEPLHGALPFLRGGVWSGFLARYSEANYMHKKMVQLSGLLADAFVASRADALFGECAEVQDKLATAQRDLYSSQCSCAYWHGLFGGIYFNHLRHTVLERQLKAEGVLEELLRGNEEEAFFERTDFDGDFVDEALLGNRHINAYVAPAQGGALIALDDRMRCRPLISMMARRPEGYHEELQRAVVTGGVMLEGGLIYDDGPRLGFCDRFYDPGTTVEAVRDNPGLDRGTFAHASYVLVDVRRGKDIEEGVEAVLRADGRFRQPRGDVLLRIAKRYLVPRRAAALQVVYTITHESGPALDGLFAPELNLGMRGGEQEHGYLQVGTERLPLTRTLAHPGLEELSVVDLGAAQGTVVAAEGCASLWHYPVHLAARSDDGFFVAFQGVTVLPVFPLRLQPGEVIDCAVMVGLEAG